MAAQRQLVVLGNFVEHLLKVIAVAREEVEIADAALQRMADVEAGLRDGTSPRGEGEDSG